MTLNPRSLTNLKGVHPDLVAIVTRAAEKCPREFTVIEGVRTQARQNELYAQGRTNKKGPIVTWTKTSNHFVNKKTGFGHAVDILPAPFDWKDTKPFNEVAEHMFAAAKYLGFGLRWGADWDKDGNPRERGESDSPHFELFGGKYT
jgi:peptidoglycan LD-endopeptidase CwlK